MRNLLYKEFRLAITAPYFLMLLFGALVLIPNWVYFVALSYLLFIAIPNIFISARGMHDISFTAMLPIRKRDVVKARILAIVILEVLQIATGAICSAINRELYPQGNMLIDANYAYIGCTFVMYAIFNAVFFPMFYKKAAGAGKPTVIALIPTLLFGFAIEALVVTSPRAAYILDGISSESLIRQIPVLAAGIAIFALISFLSYLKSAKNFEKIDL